jgi:PKD repeat protein
MYNLKLLIFISVILNGINLNAQLNKKLKVLFLGNSYTYVNNLPQLIKDIALANGDTLIFDSNCPGGQTFVGHYNDPITVTKLSSQVWNYVVLQAQSQEPALIPAPYYTNTLISAIKLDSMIKHYNTCSETVFFETWGRKNGDASNCVSLPPVCTYLGMQNRLRASYKLFADTTHSVFSPAGEAFRKSILLNPSLELYNVDESHPSLEGSYLTACVFYEVLFHKSVLTNTYNPGVSPSNSSFLQQIAHDVVIDSLSTWNIGKYNPYAPFSASLIGSLNYQFTGYSNTLSNKWYFGDGTSSILSSPAHTYSISQTYTVSHVVNSSCGKDSSSIIVTPIVLAISNLNNVGRLISIFPNPATKELSIKYTATINSPIYYKIYDVIGNEYLKGTAFDKINIESLSNGIYFFEIKENSKSYSFKFIKSDN